MKTLAILIFSFFSLTSYSQEIKTDSLYTLSAPANWGVERFPIPIVFAPQIPYKGLEDIRFTPGWAKAASDEYWSYAFLWYLEGSIKMDSKTIESNMQLYYNGLIASNGPNIPKEKLIPVLTSFKEVQKQKDDLNTFSGTISMLNYMTQQPMILNCKVHVTSCKGQTNTFVFYELSPKPLSHSIWKSLDAIWADFNCKNNK